MPVLLQPELNPNFAEIELDETDNPFLRMIDNPCAARRIFYALGPEGSLLDRSTSKRKEACSWLTGE
ncbi:hypothetical protein D3C87_954310 [compost metagenome]